MGLIKNSKILFFGFLFLISFFGLIFTFVLNEIYSPKSLIPQKKIFSIERGERIFEIAKKLEKEGIIKNRFLFLGYAVLKGKHKKILAGKYELSASMTIPQILEKFTKGEIAKVKITIPEGFTIKDIEKKLKVDLPDELEGYLFPDTYYLPIDFKAEDLVKVMRENFNKKIAPYLPEIERQGKSLKDVIILASLVEKEVKTKEDKEIVAGILWKRLKVKMPLQVDATITYITGKKTTKIPLEDLQIDSPYNTYKYLGLPPAPICNPGLESILAVIYPKETDYWYYLTTPEGKTIFSKTFLEHKIAKKKYLK
jgi:UPF0755 protein